MTKPLHDLGHSFNALAWRNGRAVDQQDRNLQRAGGVQFGARAGAAGVLGNYELNAVAFQQIEVAFQREWATRDDGLRVWQRQGGGRVDKAQQVAVLRMSGKGREILPTDGGENAGRLHRQGGKAGVEIGEVAPDVAGLGLPRPAFKGNEGGSGGGAGLDGMVAHLGGERVGGVDDMRDSFGLQIVDKAGCSTKATPALRQGLRQRITGATGVGIDRIHPGIGQRAGHQASLGGAAKQKDAHCG